MARQDLVGVRPPRAREKVNKMSSNEPLTQPSKRTKALGLTLAVGLALAFAVVAVAPSASAACALTDDAPQVLYGEACTDGSCWLVVAQHEHIQCEPLA